MIRLAALTVCGLVLLPIAAAETPVREWPSPGLELDAGPGDVTIRGHIASTSHLLELGESANAGGKQLIGADLYKHIVLPGYWRESTEMLVDVLANLHAGRVAMTRDELVLTGTGSIDSADVETRLRSAIPATVDVRVDIWAPAPLAGVCQALLASLLDTPFRLRAGESNVSGEHFPRLNRIADAMSRCQGVRLRVVGHTDSSGDAADNAAISERRAMAYADYLASQGVAEKRLVSEGRGSAEPVANNRSAAGRNRNRRVAIEIYSPP